MLTRKILHRENPSSEVESVNSIFFFFLKIWDGASSKCSICTI